MILGNVILYTIVLGRHLKLLFEILNLEKMYSTDYLEHAPNFVQDQNHLRCRVCQEDSDFAGQVT